VPAALMLAAGARAAFYGVASHDLVSYAAAVTVLLIATTGACALPARRASRQEPLEALRAE